MDGGDGGYSRRETDYEPDRDYDYYPSEKSDEEIHHNLLDFLDKVKHAKHKVEDPEEDRLETEIKQGLVGQGARQDFPPEYGNLWDNAFLDGRHRLPIKYPANEQARAAVEDGYQLGKNFDSPRVLQHYTSAADGSSTDGKIVGLCPGCNRAIRKHKTMHGDELRHLHNNSVRCFGKTSGLEGEEEGAGGGLMGAINAGEQVKDAFNDATKSFREPADEWAYRANSSLHTADYLGRPDANNPTGRGPDEYRARTWDSYLTTRPMQSPDDRNVNTPVLPDKPIKTRNINTPTPGLEGRDDDLQVTRDEDEDEDED